MLGGVIGLAISGAVFDQKLADYLLQYAPNAPAAVRAAPTSLRSLVSGDVLNGVIMAYVEAIKWTFIICVPVAGVSAFIALFIKNRPMMNPAAAKKPQDPEQQAKPQEVPSSPEKLSKSLDEV